MAVEHSHAKGPTGPELGRYECDDGRMAYLTLYQSQEHPGNSYLFTITGKIGGSNPYNGSGDKFKIGESLLAKPETETANWTCQDPDDFTFKGSLTFDGGIVLKERQQVSTKWKFIGTTDHVQFYFREMVTLPVIFKNQKHLKDNVASKIPTKSQPFSPDSDTILDACGFREPLPPMRAQEHEARKKRVLELYTRESPLFHEMNRSLRDVLKGAEPQPVYVQYFAAFIKDLRDAFFTGDKVIVDFFVGDLYRSLDVDDLEEVKKQFAGSQEEWTWPAFTCMTSDVDVAKRNGNVIVHIRCGVPNKGRDKFAPAAFCPERPNEVLYPIFALFKVVKVEENDGKLWIHCTAGA
uniref:Mono(ADP-ribosyl)transferase n=1 Tax=Noctiluca scintillans TaxID=2966 RepID=A0A7S1FK35_NOCSC|mmetsp:Transcript_7362/g.20136  ORF Transcript_7362/g.20136 Transcript_7362/m.20136 type:complete len:351 (+) Transcript_7362:52-1104(+)